MKVRRRKYGRHSTAVHTQGKYYYRGSIRRLNSRAMQPELTSLMSRRTKHKIDAMKRTNTKHLRSSLWHGQASKAYYEERTNSCRSLKRPLDSSQHCACQGLNSAVGYNRPLPRKRHRDVAVTLVDRPIPKQGAWGASPFHGASLFRIAASWPLW